MRISGGRVRIGARIVGAGCVMEGVYTVMLMLARGSAVASRSYREDPSTTRVIIVMHMKTLVGDGVSQPTAR